jgi:hypothetical protein
MTNAFKTVIRNPGAVAPAGNPTYNTDALDRAVYALGTSSPASPSHVLAYIRAKKWPNAAGFASGLVDRLNNPIISGPFASHATQNASDANFNGQASIDLTNVASQNGGSNEPFVEAGPGFRLNQSLTTLPASFTVAASLRLSTGAISVNNLFGTTDGVYSYFTAAGQLQFSPDGTHAGTVSSVLTPGTAAVVWLSWDNSAQEFRVGVNNATVLGSGSIAYSNSPAANDKIKVFGYKGASVESGSTFDGQFEGYLVLDKSYMNGSVPGDDALFTSLISAWAGLII